MGVKKHYESNTTYVNFQTGETIEKTSHQVYSLPAEPPYVKHYQNFVDDLSSILHLGRNENRILMLLISKIDYDGVISLNASSRKRIAKKCDISDGSFRNALSGLVNKDIMKRIGSNEFEVNPFFFAKGNWRDIYERRLSYQMSITYKPDGTRKIETKGLEDEQ